MKERSRFTWTHDAVPTVEFVGELYSDTERPVIPFGSVITVVSSSAVLHPHGFLEFKTKISYAEPKVAVEEKVKEKVKGTPKQRTR